MQINLRKEEGKNKKQVYLHWNRAPEHLHVHSTCTRGVKTRDQLVPSNQFIFAEGNLLYSDISQRKGSHCVAIPQECI